MKGCDMVGCDLMGYDVMGCHVMGFDEGTPDCNLGYFYTFGLLITIRLGWIYIKELYYRYREWFQHNLFYI